MNLDGSIEKHMWIFTFTKESTCRKGVYDNVQKVTTTIFDLPYQCLVYTDYCSNHYLFKLWNTVVESTKWCFSTEMLTENVCLIRFEGFLLIQKMLEKYANFNGWSKHRGVGIFIMMKLLKSLVSSETVEVLVFTRK